MKEENQRIVRLEFVMEYSGEDLYILKTEYNNDETAFIRDMLKSIMVEELSKGEITVRGVNKL